MKYYKKVKLKSGEMCILRNSNCEDAKEILQHMILTSGETENMLRYPDEIKRTEAEESEYLSELEKCRHRADFGISIQKKYWGCGIGSCIMSAIIETARQAGYEQIELDVVADNQRAINLYKKYGFKIFGTNEKAFRCRNGQYQTLHLMSCRL